ncbi:MAG: O-antigen ligase family protein [Candidatus Hydrogenedens sp.]|nr:O-antigen ligase family protein [Candidatus Hydrogenedens sp.]
MSQRGKKPEKKTSAPPVRWDWRAAWPEDFAPPRTAAVMAACIAALGMMLLVAAAFNFLAPVKVMLASAMGLYNPAMLPPGDFGMAVMLWGLGAVIIAGLVHPSAGLALLMLFRPWNDGYTYPVDNYYFLAGIYILSALWLVRLLLRGGRIQALAAAAPLAGFVALAALGLSTAWQFDNTVRQLILWLAYLMLFLLTANSLTSAAARRLLLGAFITSVAAEALFSILQFEFLLPAMRRLAQNPAVLRQYFNTDTLTPELARRLNRNRAFGTMLFPNGLAAFLILGLPVMLFGAVDAWRRRGECADGAGAPRAQALALSGAVWAAAAGAAMFSLHFPTGFREGPPVWYVNLWFLAGCAALLALLPAVPVFLAASREGIPHALRRLLLWCLPLASVLCLYALWITYSRGGMLALFGGLLWAGLVWAAGFGPLARLAAVRRLTRLAAALLLAGAFAWTLAGPGTDTFAADNAPPSAPAAPGLTEAGQAMGAADMLDPTSFRLRYTYWRVSVNIFLHNALTGVGLGNFADAYPRYQDPAAGDVREAHNGYLQAFAETGIAGGALFALFSLGVGAWGARRVLRETNPSRRLWTLGLYAGLTAFCMHAFIDINFSHPSLAMAFFVVAALLWRCGGPAPSTEAPAPAQAPSRPRIPHRAAALCLLVAMALSAGVAARVFLQELSLSRMSFVNVTNDGELMRMYQTAARLLTEIQWAAFDRENGKGPARPPQMLFADALTLYPEPEAWAVVAEFYAPVPGNQRSFQKLPQGQRPGLDALLVLQRLFKARNCGVEGLLLKIQWLEGVDSRWPHSQMLAYHIARCYELLAQNLQYAEKYRDKVPEWRKKYRQWAETALKRNPHSAEMANFYGTVLWHLALNDPDTPKLETVMDALACKREVVAMSPVAALYRYGLAWELDEAAKLFREEGDAEGAALLEKEAEEARRIAAEIQQIRIKNGLPV